MVHSLLPYWKLLPVSLALFFVIWILSVFKKDVSIVDCFWGLGFLALYGIRFFDAEYSTLRGDLVFVLLGLWSVRLSLYLLLRKHGEPEDARYQKIRTKYGTESFWWKSLFIVFFLQATLLWIIAAPVLWISLFPQPEGFTWLDALGGTLWAIGFAFEAIGDFQMARFKKDPANRGKVCREGLWSLTRHPNYFGEALIWWGFFAITCNIENGVFSAFGPVLLTFLLLRVSGVSLLEEHLLTTKPAYREYLREVPGFFPRLWPRPRSKGR